MNLCFSPSPFPMEQIKYDDEQQYQQAFNFGLNRQIVSSSSSSSASCHIFFSPTQDHAGFYHPQYSYQRHNRHLHDDYYGYGGSSSYEIERKTKNGVKLSMWKKEDEDGVNKECVSAKIEVKTSCLEEELSSNSSSYKCSNATPIRVCSDCHTTKTPLWRSGPKGPKSLCNACGIRQRKARRAMAAAANGGGGTTSNPPRATKEKEKMGKIGLKKRYKMDGSSSSGRKKINGFEDFLINLSNKLAIHRVFPQDEKEAAILLMALSSGLVHG